jgi:hypothetical protein
MKGKRIFTQFTKDRAVESDWMQLPNGQKAYDVPVLPKVLPIETLKEEGFPIETNDQGVAETNHCVTHTSKEVQIPVKLTAATDADGIVRIGLHDGSFKIFGGATASENVTVAGKFAANTLEVIGQQAQFGKYHISRIHATASDESVYNTEMAIKSVSHNGRCNEDAEVYWERSTQKDENAKVRNATFKTSELVLDGTNYLEIALPKGTSLDLAIYSRYEK